jgi:O-antigen/teichoic acid export membrane protein
VWALFYALAGYFSTLDFGLVPATLRHVAASRGRGAHAEAGAFATLGLLGYLALGIGWAVLVAAVQAPLLAWLRIPEALLGTARSALFAGAAVFALSGFASVTIAVAQGYGRFDLANGVLLAVAAVQAAGFGLALGRGWGLEGLVAVVGGAWLVGCVLGVGLLRAALPVFRWQSPRASVGRLREVLSFGGPMQITNLLAVVHLHLDKVLLSRFVALATVAPYELGSRVATAASTLPQLILLAVLPEAAALHEAGNRERLRELYDRGSRYALTGVVVVMAPLVVCADRLYGTWLGPGHADAALVLRALALAVGISLATGMGTTLARAIARTDLEAWFALVALAIHLGLSLWLIPSRGLAGAVLATLLGTLVGAVAFMVLLGRTLAWPFWRVVVRPCAVPLVAAAIAVGSGLALDRVVPVLPAALGWAGLALTAAGASAVALAVILATRYLRWSEVRALLSRAG